MSIVVAGVIQRGERFIVIRRGRGLSRYPGLLCFPGGNVEDTDSDLIEAVRREIWEELGLFLQPEKKPDFKYVSKDKNKFVVHFFNMKLPDEDFSLHIPFREVEEVLFMTVTDLLNTDSEMIPSLAAWVEEMRVRFNNKREKNHEFTTHSS